MSLEEIYKKHEALLEGHFLLSSGKHSNRYLQSAKVLQHPKVAGELADRLADLIVKSGIQVDLVCSPALGGVIAGYELARSLGVRSIFTERKDGEMVLRRGFEIAKGEKVLICEDIITTGGSALESAREVERAGGEVVGFSAIANRGFCVRNGSDLERKENCKLPENKPLFALEDFIFEVFDPENCPLCADGSEAIKPGSRN
ncbi:orotate phosphoribosyltransferase [Thiovulum sp. ES]|nr:orotate phosphoribosyltransferase [Thiovulum sp. ES]